MKSKLFPLFLALALAVVPALRATELEDNTTAYLKLANGIIAQAVVGKLDVAAVHKDTNKMIQLAAGFAVLYKAKHPEGAKLMDLMVAKKDALSSMTLAAIDEEFEAQAIQKAHGKDFGFDMTTEENEHFNNPVDCFVHPATAAILATLWEKEHKEEYLTRIQAELQEVLGHCRRTVDVIKK